MWRYLLMLLVFLPPSAIILNHDIISFIMIIGWFFLVIPLCIIQAIDFFRNGDTCRVAWVKNVIRIPIALFGLLSLLFGVSIVVWCIYNIAIQQLPEYTGPTDPIGLWLGRFGIAPVLISFGWYLLRLSVSRINTSPAKGGA